MSSAPPCTLNTNYVGGGEGGIGCMMAVKLTIILQISMGDNNIILLAILLLQLSFL